MNGDFSYFESSSRRWPDPVAPLECTDFDYVIEYPTTRINSYWSGNGSGYYDDWLSEDSSDQTLVKRWSPEKTAFDPCPPGWRVPDAGVFSTIDFSNAIFDRRLGYLVDGDVFPVRECNPDNLCKYFTSGLNADGTVISMNLAESDIRQTSWSRKIEYGYIRCQKDVEVDNSMTIQDVLNGNDGEIFTVTGYIRMVNDWDYGDYTIVDHTGEVYIYGTVDADGNSKNFTSMGIKEGDFVTVTGPKNTYNGRAELKDVKVEKHNPVYDVSVEEFLNNSTATDKYYRLRGEVQNISDGTNGCFYLKDHSGSVSVSGLALVWGGKIGQFGSLGIEEGDIVTIVGVKGTSEINSAFYISHQRLVKDVTIAYSEDVEDQVKYAFEYDDRFRISRIRFSEYGEDGDVYEDVYKYSENQITVDRISNGKTTPIYIYHLSDMGLPVKMEIRPNQEFGGELCCSFYQSGKVKEFSEDTGESRYIAKWSPEGNMTELVSYSDIVETFKYEYYNIVNKANIDFSVFVECNPIVMYGSDQNVFSCFTNRYLLKSSEMSSVTWNYELNLKDYVSKFTISDDDYYVAGYVTYMN
jgi:DNA/RNA endonuclease YhcR with UshA esterase domain